MTKLKDHRVAFANAIESTVISHGMTDSKTIVEALIQTVATAVISLEGDTAGNIEWGFRSLYDAFSQYGYVEQHTEERTDN